MTKIIYVRHGQTEWNTAGRYQGQSDVELTEAGREQAAKLAAHFPVEKVHAVYSSDLKRALETAACIAAAKGLDVQPRAALRELSFGDWEGLTYEQITERWPEALRDFFARPDLLDIPHGESFQILQKRALACIDELIARHDGETIVIVAHGAILRTILAAALHMDLRYVWSIRQFNTAVNIVCYEKEGATVELINSTAHLSL